MRLKYTKSTTLNITVSFKWSMNGERITDSDIEMKRVLLTFSDAQTTLSFDECLWQVLSSSDRADTEMTNQY